MNQSKITLIVGLGNPGTQYTETRHNLGLWLIHRMKSTFKFKLSEINKFTAKIGCFELHKQQIRVAVPLNFMNLSGQSVALISVFYSIQPEKILIVHDELDIPVGSIKFKSGGGHGGHNGLRNVIEKLGSSNFSRLRIGIGCPKPRINISKYVLGKPSIPDQLMIKRAVDEAIKLLPDLLSKD